jgi:hypothetical protein
MCVGELYNFLTVHGPKRLGIENRIGDDQGIDDYIESIYRRGEEMGLRACGFKVSYGEMRNWEERANKVPLHWMHLWKYFRDNNIQVINLFRRNLFKRHLSNTLALNEKCFKDNPYQRTVKIKIDEYINLSNIITGHKYDVLEYLKDNERIDIFYEDICADRMTELEKICRFLNVENYVNYPQEDTQKQMTKNPWDYIENSEDLKEEAAQRLQTCNDANVEYLRSLLDTYLYERQNTSNRRLLYL